MSADPPRPRRRRLLWALVGVAALAVVGFVGVPYVYVHFVNDPAPPLSFEQLDAAESGAVDGTWNVVSPSTAVLRIGDMKGRTTAVEGSLELSGTTLLSAESSVDLTTLTTGSAAEDARLHGDVLDTEQFPVAILTLDQPVSLGSLSTDAEPVRATATGTLSLRGVDRTVEVQVTVRRSGPGLALNASVPIGLADRGIDTPSSGVATTEETGVLELRLALSR